MYVGAAQLSSVYVVSVLGDEIDLWVLWVLFSAVNKEFKWLVS